MSSDLGSAVYNKKYGEIEVYLAVAGWRFERSTLDKERAVNNHPS